MGFVLLCFTAVWATTLHVVTSPPPGTKPVYRYWNNRLGTHFYTLDEAERAKLDSQYSHVFIYEGVAFYAWPDPNSLSLVSTGGTEGTP